MEVNEISIFWPKNPMNDTSQFREDIREIYIYIEKFANMGRSELHSDISRLFLDDRDISGFLSHSHTIIKSAQSCER